MTPKEFFKREKHIILHGQSRSFRTRKWIVIFVFATTLYFWKGWVVLGESALFCAIAGIALHFFLRYKTDAWTKSWGPYKRIPLDGE